MQLTFSSEEPVEQVAAAVSAIYGVTVHIDRSAVPQFVQVTEPMTGASPTGGRSKHDPA